MCVDSAVDSQNYHKPVNMWPCHNQGGNQYWMLSKHSEIRRDDGCLDYSGGDSVIIYPCHGQKGNQEWIYKEVGEAFWIRGLSWPNFQGHSSRKTENSWWADICFH